MLLVRESVTVAASNVANSKKKKKCSASSRIGYCTANPTHPHPHLYPSDSENPSRTTMKVENGRGSH